MKKIFFILSIFISLFAYAGTYSVKTLPNVQVIDQTKHLSNPDGIVSPQIQAQIDTLLADARRVSSAEIAAVIVDDIDSDDIDSYATELFNQWRIGKKDKNNGILLIVAKDSHQATIRTGYGAEGVLPDILAGRIIYDVMIPHFKQDDYEGGMLAGVKELHRLVTNPDAASELKSELEDQKSADTEEFFNYYLGFGVVVAIILLLIVVYFLFKNRKLPDYDKYMISTKFIVPFLICTVFFIGIPVLAFLIIWALRRHWRNHSRKCMRCGAKMNKLDEDTDNKYLSMAQDTEEKLNSVDYDVWLCPECGETDIYPYINNASQYKECGYCHARALKLSGTSVLSEPTTTRQGAGLKHYTCMNCHKQVSEPYQIPKKEVPIVIIGPGAGRGFGGGGGGSFGGGFGGGFSGGGGATGRW